MVAVIYLQKSNNFVFLINILSLIIFCISSLGFCISLEIGCWKKWQTLNFGLICLILFGILVIYFLFLVQQEHDIEIKELKEEKLRLVRFLKYKSGQS